MNSKARRREKRRQESIKQLCDISSEIIDNECRRIDNIYKEFYDTLKLSKKDYEERRN